jgi:hypothetical protein
MDKRKKLILGAVSALVVIAVATGAGFAASRDDDKPLGGSAYDKATAAALEHVGGGTVVETEAGDDGAAYGVEIQKADGSVVEVELDKNFNVIGSAQDDDGPGDQDQGGEDD